MVGRTALLGLSLCLLKACRCQEQEEAEVKEKNLASTCPGMPGVPPLEEPIEGTWAPAIVFETMRVSLLNMQAPEKVIGDTSMALEGLCSDDAIPSASFAYTPAVRKGDWIAKLGTNVTNPTSVELNVNGASCKLTAVAVTTVGLPSLRLQFDNCAVKTALSVPLKEGEEEGAAKNDVNLVEWLCAVSRPLGLCEGLGITPTTAGNGTSLELGPLVQAQFVNSVTSMQISSSSPGCFDDFSWHMVDTAVGVADWNSLLRIRESLAPENVDTPRVEAVGVLSRLCLNDCDGNVPGECKVIQANCVDSQACRPRLIVVLLLCLILALLLGCCCARCCVRLCCHVPLQEVGIAGANVKTTSNPGDLANADGEQYKSVRDGSFLGRGARGGTAGVGTWFGGWGQQTSVARGGAWGSGGPAAGRAGGSYIAASDMRSTPGANGYVAGGMGSGPMGSTVGSQAVTGRQTIQACMLQ